MHTIQDGLKHIMPKDFSKIYRDENIKIIDIREPFELQELPFQRGISIPMNQLLTNYQSLLDKNITYYILCHHGQRSYLVTEVLTNKGYNVINVVGGIDLVNRFDSPKRE